MSKRIGLRYIPSISATPQIPITILLVDAYTEDRCDWIKTGDSPYLDMDDGDINKVHAVSVYNNPLVIDNFGFSDTNLATITSATLEIYVKKVGAGSPMLHWWLWDGLDWNFHGFAGITTTDYAVYTDNLFSVFNTPAKLNAAKLKLITDRYNVDGQEIHVTFARIILTGAL